MLAFCVLWCITAFADPARFLKDDHNSAYHAQHLLEHVGSKNCKVSGNYIKVRDAAGSERVHGHLEQSDSFVLEAIDGNWAKITVLYAAQTSPDSHTGLSGWVDADYVECPCLSAEYYDGPARTYYYIAMAKAGDTHLREDPSKTSTTLARLAKGDMVEVISKYPVGSYTWYRVRYGVKMGFIRSDMLDLIDTKVAEDFIRPKTESATATPAIPAAAASAELMSLPSFREGMSGAELAAALETLGFVKDGSPVSEHGYEQKFKAMNISGLQTDYSVLQVLYPSQVRLRHVFQDSGFAENRTGTLYDTLRNLLAAAYGEPSYEYTGGSEWNTLTEPGETSCSISISEVLPPSMILTGKITVTFLWELAVSDQ